MKIWCALAASLALGCTAAGTRVPSAEPQPTAAAASVSPFCAIDLAAPESWHAVLTADDVAGVDCVPPDAGGDRFSLGFSHAGWWLQLDIGRASLTIGAPHAFDGQAALLALDCWDWDGTATVDADDRARWAVRLDAHCRNDATKSVVATFSGEH